MKKGIFNTPVFWKGLLIAMFIAIVIGISCAFIFYIRIFEKWDRAKVIKLDIDNDGYRNVIYMVNEQEYRQRVAVDDETWYEVRSGEKELYVSYLLRDPIYIFLHNVRTQTIIVFSVLWFGFTCFGFLTAVK